MTIRFDIYKYNRKKETTLARIVSSFLDGSLSCLSG